MSNIPGQDSERPLLPFSVFPFATLWVCMGWHCPYCTQQAHTCYYYKQTWGRQVNLYTVANFISIPTFWAMNQVMSPKQEETNTDPLGGPHFRRCILSSPRNKLRLLSRCEVNKTHNSCQTILLPYLSLPLKSKSFYNFILDSWSFVRVYKTISVSLGPSKDHWKMDIRIVPLKDRDTGIAHALSVKGFSFRNYLLWSPYVEGKWATNLKLGKESIWRTIQK